MEAKNTADRARKELQELNRTLEERVAAGIAERLQLEQGLLVEKEAARLREQFVAILGHDLRNPLALIVGGLNVLLREPQSDKGRRVLTLMSQSTERMSGLIQDMLELARCRDGQGIAIAPKPTDLRAVLEQVVHELQTAHPTRDIQSSLQIEGQVSCDGGRIAQLVSHLLGNALTHGAPDRPVKVTASIELDEIIITVANEGEPIPNHIKDHLFEPFFRATDSSKKQGLGLGLFISYEIARSHGGTPFRFNQTRRAPRSSSLCPHRRQYVSEICTTERRENRAQCLLRTAPQVTLERDSQHLRSGGAE